MLIFMRICMLSLLGSSVISSIARFYDAAIYQILFAIFLLILTNTKLNRNVKEDKGEQDE